MIVILGLVLARTVLFRLAPRSVATGNNLLLLLAFLSVKIVIVIVIPGVVLARTVLFRLALRSVATGNNLLLLLAFLSVSRRCPFQLWIWNPFIQSNLLFPSLAPLFSLVLSVLSSGFSARYGVDSFLHFVGNAVHFHVQAVLDPGLTAPQ